MGVMSRGDAASCPAVRAEFSEGEGMSKWQEYKFSDVLIDNNISYGIVQPGSHTEVDSVPIIRVNNIKDGNIKIDDVLKVSSEIEKKYQRTRLEGGELLITVVGSVGECAIVPESLNGWNVARAVSVARIQEAFDKRFVKYCFKSEDLKFQMYGNTNDTVQPTLNLSSLKELVLNIPPLPEQRAIAAVLSSLDDKIDLLHRQNKTLEAIAETLFRQWFIEEAQADWEEVELGCVVETTSGGTPSRSKMEYYEDGTISWVKSKELPGTFILDTEEMITEEALKNSSAKLLPPNSILIAMYGATVGEYAITSKEMTCNQAVCALKPNAKYPYTFLFLFVKNNKEELINMAVGSAQQNISQLLIKKLLVPSCHEKIAHFHTVIDPFFGKVKSNITQIHTLEKLRDTLLPKLMSGEVRTMI
jgi:type I restriction enzyme, S subunit